jgi:hypothetical protein
MVRCDAPLQLYTFAQGACREDNADALSSHELLLVRVLPHIIARSVAVVSHRQLRSHSHIHCFKCGCSCTRSLVVIVTIMAVNSTM